MTPAARIMTKQLNSMQDKGKGVLPMHACSAKAGKPSVKRNYTDKSTWGYKVFNMLLKIVSICKYYTSGGGTAVVQHAKKAR